MRRTLAPAVLTALVLATPSLAHAQAKGGDKEVLIQGQVFSLINPQFKSTTGNFLVGFGYFLSDRSEVLIRPIFTISSQSSPGTPEVRDPFTGRVLIPGQPGGTSVDVDAGASTGYRFFFGAASSKVKPYLGTDLDLQSFKTEQGGSVVDNLYFTGLGGVKNYLSERAALDFNASYGRQVKNSDLSLFRFTVGITYLF